MNRIDIPSVDVRVRWQPPHRLSSHAIGSRLPAFLLLALVAFHLTGCGSSSSGSFGYAERPPTNRTALVAWQEWTRFGRSTVVYGGHANGYTNRNGVDERSEPLTSRVGSYWASCGHPEWNGRTSGRPWSGAFVSWVMTQSGVEPFGFPAGRTARSISRRALRPSAQFAQSGLRAARAQRICAQAGRSGVHRHGGTNLALRRLAHGASAHRQYGKPLRRRDRRARRLRSRRWRQREEQRHDESLPGRRPRPSCQRAGQDLDDGGREPGELIRDAAADLGRRARVQLHGARRSRPARSRTPS